FQEQVGRRDCNVCIYVVLAALNLGCYPVRYSRSQQHCNPRTYLTPRAPEHVSLAPRIFDEGSEESCPWLPPVQSVRIATDVNSNISVSQTYHRWSHFLSENCPYDCDQSTRIETKTSPIGQVYPLYHGIHHQNTQPLTGSPVCENIMSDTIFVGIPIGTSLAELGVNGSSQNLFSSSDIGGKGDGLQDMKRTNEKSFLAECDLSLRLGLFSDPRVQVEKDSIFETGDVGQSSLCDGGKVNELFIESEGNNLGATVGKRKAIFRSDLEDKIFSANQGLRLIIKETTSKETDTGAGYMRQMGANGLVYSFVVSYTSEIR
ncbi:hypothetical protein Goarm_001406, partial [Gossypium armourianum]|nr:hypothetical protein [Gossypium armourianum]